MVLGEKINYIMQYESTHTIAEYTYSHFAQALLEVHGLISVRVAVILICVQRYNTNCNIST